MYFLRIILLMIILINHMFCFLFDAAEMYYGPVPAYKRRKPNQKWPDWLIPAKAEVMWLQGPSSYTGKGPVSNTPPPPPPHTSTQPYILKVEYYHKNPTDTFLFTMCGYLHGCFVTMLYFENVKQCWSWTLIHRVLVTHWSVSTVCFQICYRYVSFSSPLNS